MNLQYTIPKNGPLFQPYIGCSVESAQIPNPGGRRSDVFLSPRAYPFTDIIAPLAAETRNGHPKYFLKAVAPPEQIRELWGKGKHAHVACFSSNSELSNQWQKYAHNGTGYAIGFSREAVQKWCNVCGTSGSGVTLLPMVYDPSVQTQLIRTFLDNIDATERRRCTQETIAATRVDARGWLGILSTSLKRPEAVSEDEWRILVIQPSGSGFFPLQVAEDGVGYFDFEIVSPKYITGVICGPNNSIDTKEVERILALAGLEAVPIRRATA